MSEIEEMLVCDAHIEEARDEDRAVPCVHCERDAARRERDANMDAFVERCNAWHKLDFEYKLLTDRLSAANKALVWWTRQHTGITPPDSVRIAASAARAAEGGEG